MKRLFILLFAFFVFHFSVFIADCLADTTWQNIGPYGGVVSGVVTDKADSRIVYAAAYGGVFKSTNGGASWHPINTGLTDDQAVAITIDPNDSLTLYIGTYSGGVFKSINGGDTWNAVNSGLPTSNNYVAFVAIDPKNSQVLYAGGAFSNPGIRKTVNGGLSWSEAGAGITSQAVVSFAMHPTDSQTIYVGTYDGGIFKSSDGGATWSGTSNGLPSGPARHVLALAIAPDNGNVLYAGTDAGVYKSTNGGSSWSAASTGITTVPVPVTSLVIDPADTQTVYAGTLSNGAFKTSVGGALWEPANSSLTSKEIISLRIDPANSKMIYAGTAGGVFKSSGGALWHHVSSGISLTNVWSVVVDPGNSQTIFAALYGGGGISKSTDGGVSWSTVNNGLTNTTILSLAMDPSNSQTLFASTYGGIFKTTDGGVLWKSVSWQLAAVWKLAVDPGNSKVVYAGTSNDGIYKTSDGGTTWGAVNSGLPADPSNMIVYALAIDPKNSQIVYAGAKDGNGVKSGVYRSVDGGANWSAVNSGLTYSFFGATNVYSVLSIAVDPVNSQAVYAGTAGKGVYKSVNGGNTWVPAGNGLPSSMSVDYLAIDPTDNQTVYAGNYKTTNGGASWSAINSNAVKSLAIDSSGQTVYAGTTSGIYKALFSDTFPVITSDASATFHEGTTGSLRVNSGGWPAPVFSFSGTLPQGLAFDLTAGVISGAPASGSVGTYPLIITAGNGFPPDAVRSLTMTVMPASSLAAAITTPVKGAGLTELSSISGSASGSGLSKVEVQVTDGTYYLQADDSFALTPTWLPASDTTAWFMVTDSVLWRENITYTIKARAANGSSTSALSTSTFTILTPAEKSSSILSMTSSPGTLRAGDSATISGSLTGAAESQTVTLIVTPPATVATPNPAPVFTSVTTDSGGNFTRVLSEFAVPGVYLVQARFEGTSTLAASFASKALGVTPQSGYAIIVSGKATDNSLIDLHTATTDTIYATLVNKRGFLPGNVSYLKSTTSAAVSKQQVQDAITGWAKTKLTASPAPLYLIMIDHGSTTGFVLGEETLTPDELAGWLNALESDSGVIDSGALDSYQRFVIIGTCYSGAFAPKLSKAGRIVITSAGADEQSLAGFSIYNSATSTTYSGGEYFIDTMINFLGRGDSFKDAVIQSSSNVALRDPRKVDLGQHSGVYDTLAQHPLLDDNGDQTAGYLLSATTDGAQAAGLALGVGIRTLGNPADIAAVTDTAIIPPSQTDESPLWLQVNDNSRIAKAWMEIRTPVTSVSSNGATGQVIPRLLTMPLSFDGSQWNSSYSFPNAGTYNILYYTQDNRTSDISPAAHSVVYKQLASNAGPSAFSLASPADEGTVGPMFPLSWQEVTSANSVTYTLLVATDQNFDSIVYQEEGLPQAATYIADGKLKNPADNSYYCQNGDSYCFWKVRAIDRYGAVTESNTRSFTIVETNGLPALLYGFVRDDTTGAPVAGAKLAAGSAGATTLANGAYLMAVPGGAVSVSASAAGYQSKTVSSVIARPGKVAVTDFSLSASGGSQPGDCNADGNVSVAEVQSAIGMFLGVRTPSACVDKDGAGGVSMAELQKVVNSFLGL